MKHYRKALWTLLLLVLAVVQGIGVVRLLTLPDEIIRRLSLLPALEMVVGGLWTLALMVAAWRVWRESRVMTALWVLTAYLLYQGARSLIFARADYDRQRIPFLLIIAGLSLGAVMLTAGIRYAKSRMKNTLPPTEKN